MDWCDIGDFFDVLLVYFALIGVLATLQFLFG